MKTITGVSNICQSKAYMLSIIYSATSIKECKLMIGVYSTGLKGKGLQLLRHCGFQNGWAQNRFRKYFSYYHLY